MVLELILKHERWFLTMMCCFDFQRMNENWSLALGFQVSFCEKAQNKLCIFFSIILLFFNQSWYWEFDFLSK